MHEQYPRLVEGNRDSSVRVITYEDLQCKDCAWLRLKMDEQMLHEYGDRVAFEHREFPSVRHEWSRPAAMAARHFVTVSHGVAVAFRRDILSEISIITADSLDMWIQEFAAAYGADADTALMALSDPSLAKAVDADVASGRQQNVEKTPTVFVGETVFIEWVPMGELTATIDAALERAR